MRSREQSSLPRRGFLSGLTALPLIGGGVSLIGQPTAAAVPVTDGLLWSYKSWLHMEHRMLSFELAGYDKDKSEHIERSFAALVPPAQQVPGFNWHIQWSRPGSRGPAGWIDAPQPSTRAAVILSAAGVPLA